MSLSIFAAVQHDREIGAGCPESKQKNGAAHKM
jgi:hypothetical protein